MARTQEQRINLFAGIFTAVVIAAVAAFLLLKGSPMSPDEVVDALDLETPARPGPPYLADDLGGGPAETVCVSFDLGDNFETAMKPLGRSGEEEEIGSLVERTISTLGLDTGTTGCGLRLDVGLSGRRLSASYQGIGTCPTGLQVEGTATLTAGTATREYGLDLDVEPPQTISGCSQRDPDRPIAVNRWREELLVAPLADAFGDQFEAVAVIVGLARDDEVALGDPGPGTTTHLIRALAIPGGRRWAANGMLGMLAVQYPGDPDLAAAVPHLIRVFAEVFDADQPKFSRDSDPYGKTLQWLTGAGTDAWTPVDWYDWWLEQGTEA